MSTQVWSLEEELELITRGTEEVFPEEELVEKLKKARRNKQPLKVKLGVDPTGTDLHLGHLIPVLKLKQFQDLGHEAILIIGDYTAMVGDPTGRNKTRPQLTHEQVLENCRTYQEQVFRILDREKTRVVYNGEWFSKMTFQDVIRLMSQMTVARMLEREDFANRMQNQLPISLHELIYPLMQGYDSVAIEADIELGGIDQKFNILVGRELQRTMGLEPQVGVCNPILIGLDGKEKMSKSLGNYIGINEPPYEMYGKTMSIPDELMMMYFELITDIPMAELRDMENKIRRGELHPMEAKRRLAREIVARFHSVDAALEAEAEFNRVFRDNQIPADIPEVILTQEDLKDGRIWLVRLLVKAELVSSNGEGRRLIQQGGVRINGRVIDDVDYEWTPEQDAVIQIGKRRFARVRISE
ncbi:MAG TPA: tyrosine--tRNA ligase [Firmicutes bacterium]|nr:tyrosine--tRNA ligase [Bacillota bacterium]